MRLSTHFRSALACLIALSGCDAFDGGANGLDLVVNQIQVAPGDEALAVLDNDSGHDYAYNCPQLQRLAAGAFVAVNPSEFCQAILVGVEAGGTVAFRVPVPSESAEGSYRVAVRVGRDVPGDETVVSDAFRVVRPS